MNDMTTDLGDLLGWTPRAETENAAPAGPRNGVETSAAHESACTEYSETDAAVQAWAALDRAKKWVAWREDDRKGTPTKVPYVTPQHMARANDPATRRKS
ncbi:hypothetical protein ACEPPZ_06050 [Paracoccus yeei]|uniref:hypothetical protein n=1 Tax=Paracoccus yeei TaxID=147645 RepID=UPI0028D32617|nr:hypothetical protein [Paracoccus yeei]